MGKNKSRVRFSVYNSLTSIGCQGLMIILQFAVRTVMIRTLGKEYLGITGLFSNILTLLSMAEFGVGVTITFRLYEAVKQEDKTRTLQLMDLFKKVYRLIGAVVLVMGLILMPLLPVLIKDVDRLKEIGVSVYLVFGLYLLNSVVSYFFAAYKSEFIKVNQQAYLINIIQYATLIIGSFLQIFVLIVFKNFMLYVAVFIGQTIALNLSAAYLADKKYPFLKEHCSAPLSFTEIREIFKDTGAAFLYKVNYIILTATDNLVLSFFLGLNAVAIYSNYYAFFLAIHGVLDRIYNSIVHSIGDLHVSNDLTHEYDIFEEMMFLTAILGGTAFVGLADVSDELLYVWLGKGWSLGWTFSILLGIQLYTNAFRFMLAKYREAYGLFRQAMIRPVICSIANVVISIVLVQRMGISGVVLGTVISEWGTMIWFDPMIIHKYGFQNHFSLVKYYLKFLWYFLISFGFCLLDHVICGHFFVNGGWFSVILHCLVCAVTLPLGMILLNFKSGEVRYLRKLLERVKRKLIYNKNS